MCIVVTLILPSVSASTDDWAHWRGPLMTGEALNADPPVRWSETENVQWKTSLDGLGHSTPIVVGDRVFLTYAKEVGEKFTPRPDTAPGAHDNTLVDSEVAFVALAVNRDDGTIAWQRELHRSIPHEGAHITASLASASAVADSERVWFYFGSYGLYCLDHDGKEIWRKNLGTMHSKHGHGEGSSPVLSGDILALNWDHEGPSFTIALNKRNGERIWQRDRDEETSWSSPIVVSHDGRKQLIVSGTKRIRAYDLETGDVIWQCGGMSSNIVASPVAGDGMVFLGSSYETRQMLGIKLAGAKGDITSSENVVWSRTSRTPYVPSPLLVSGQLYFLRHYQGILTRLVAETGEEPTGPFRLGQMEEIYSSPVSAAGRIYVTDRRGNTAVFTTGPQPEFLAVNRLTDRFSASAAIAGRQLFLRGERFLYCLQAARKNEPSE